MGSFLVCRLILPDTGVSIQQDAKDESFNTFDNNRVAKVDLFTTYAIEGQLSQNLHEHWDVSTKNPGTSLGVE